MLDQIAAAASFLRTGPRLFNGISDGCYQAQSGDNDSTSTHGYKSMSTQMLIEIRKKHAATSNAALNIVPQSTDGQEYSRQLLLRW